MPLVGRCVVTVWDRIFSQGGANTFPKSSVCCKGLARMVRCEMVLPRFLVLLLPPRLAWQPLGSRSRRQQGSL
jgi:hypothetical protein